MLHTYISYLLATILTVVGPALTGSLTGVVRDEQGQALAGIPVTITSLKLAAGDESYTAHTTTNDQGQFQFDQLPAGTYRIAINHLSYAEYELETTIFTQQQQDISITLQPSENLIEDVIVFAKSNTELAREQAVRAVVVDVAAASQQPSTLAELVNRSTGVRIRQSGGLGNSVDISINGFQGNSVQYFRDGIPMDYLGGSYGLHNVPINLLERVEIYKGVVPVSLGGDALGGAVNLVTHYEQQSHVSASYELASFNTHIAQLSLYKTFNENAFVGVDAFYNYADNDYDVDVQVVDEQANPVNVTVPLFHNAYKQYFAEAYAGFKNKSWADELRFSLAIYDVQRESQHPALMTHPYGALMTYNKGVVPSIRYRKKWLDGQLGFDQFAAYSRINRSRVDTVSGTYDWYGNFYPRAVKGESPRTSLSDIDFDQFTWRSYAYYRLNPKHKLEANLVFNHQTRVGSDPYGLRFAGTDIDILSREAQYQRSIVGLSWESNWLNDLLTNQTTFKYFGFKAVGINGFMPNATDLNYFTTTINHNFGVGNAVKYTIDARQFIRASVELTNRLPREAELFGDQDTRAPNFQLKPERSFNANLGYSYLGDKIKFEVGTFYRKTKGMILLVPVQPPFAQYQNLDSIRGYGFDIDVNYRLNEHLTMSANTTWQDNRMVDVADGLHKWIEGTRLRNTPYFFANAGIQGHWRGIFQDGDGIKPYLHWNYIREFYLNHIPRDKEPQGFLGLWGTAGVPVTNLIPDQHLLSAGLNYFFSKSPLNIGIEVKNLTNTKLYDYYKIQRPGRSVHVKLNYTLFN